MEHLTSTQVELILAGRSGHDPRTVKKWRRGGRVRDQVRERLEILARELGLEPHTNTRTVKRRLTGAPGTSTTDARVDRAVADLGLEHLMHPGR